MVRKGNLLVHFVRHPACLYRKGGKRADSTTLRKRSAVARQGVVHEGGKRLLVITQHRGEIRGNPLDVMSGCENQGMWPSVAGAPGTPLHRLGGRHQNLI